MSKQICTARWRTGPQSCLSYPGTEEIKGITATMCKTPKDNTARCCVLLCPILTPFPFQLAAAADYSTTDTVCRISSSMLRGCCRNGNAFQCYCIKTDPGCALNHVASKITSISPYFMQSDLVSCKTDLERKNDGGVVGKSTWD